MKRILIALLPLLPLLMLLQPAPALAVDAVGAQTVSACGTPNNTPVVGNSYAQTQDTTGKLCVNAAVTASISGSTSNATSGQATTSTNIPTVSYIYGFNGTTWDQLQDDASKNLKINCVIGCAGGTASNASSGVATSSTNGTTNAWLYGFNGTTWDQLQVDGSKNLKIGINAGSIANTSFGATQATAANLNATVVGNGTFAVQNAPTASATGGATPASVLSANSTNATVLKASAGTLYHTSLQNSSTTALAYIIYFNTATTPTCTATPYYGPFLIPFVGSTGNGGSGIVDESGVGASFTTGISYCITTAPGGTGSVAANAITGGILIK